MSKGTKKNDSWRLPLGKTGAGRVTLPVGADEKQRKLFAMWVESTVLPELKGECS